MSDPSKTSERRFWNISLLLSWIRDTWRMRGFVRNAGKPGVAPATGVRRIGVVITPWFGSPVPWYSMTVGLLLAAKGHSVTFILDDQPFGPVSRIWRMQLVAIRTVLAVAARRFSVLHLSGFDADHTLPAESRKAVERLAYLNAVWLHKGETGIDRDTMAHHAEQLDTAHRRIDRLLDCHRQDLLFVPGGICVTSGVWFRAAKRRSIRVSTYDSGGYGVLLLAVDGIACQLHDIPRAFALLTEHAGTAVERRRVISFAEEEIAKRRAGTDKFSSQLKHASEKRPEYEGGVLIALNSPWDSAALGLHAVFDTTQEWIIETVRHLLTHTEAPVLVRQHPVERLPSVRSVDDTRGVLREHFGDHPRLHFIAAEDPVNSYDLMEQVKAMVVYTSTIGVEAVAHGRLVITESTSYYADLGFVMKASTAEEYYAMLSDAVAGTREVTPAMRENALFCYYITQCCNWMFTPFLVQAFPEWSRHGLEALTRDPTVEMLVRAIENDIPISYLNHLKRWSMLEAAEAHV